MKEKISGTGLWKKYERTSQKDGPKEQYHRGWQTRRCNPASKITYSGSVIVLINGKP